MNYAKGCTLLIHEATFDHDEQARARAKKHTTSKEVLSVVNHCYPWRTILTHFSIKSLRIPEVLPEYSNHKIMLAYDQMRFTLNDLDWAYRYLPIFQAVLDSTKAPTS